MKQYSFLREFNVYSSDELESNGFKGGLAGGALGITAGGIAGRIINKKHFQELNDIKNIVINSDSPQECIQKLKEINNSKSLRYSRLVKKYSEKKPNDWKNGVCLMINFEKVEKNIVPAAIGGFLGHGIGTVTGMSLTKPIQ